MHQLSREIPIVPRKSALLFIDVQNYNAGSDGGEYRDEGLSPAEAETKYEYFFKRLKKVALPNMQRLQKACREKGIEVLYTVIESLTADGRDRSLDYKITGFNVPKDSSDARVLDVIQGTFVSLLGLGCTGVGDQRNQITQVACVTHR